MTDAETWALAYLIAWTVGGHIWVGYRWHDRRRHYKRSKAARKAAATRKRNGTHRKPRQPEIPAGRSPWSGPEPKVQPAPPEPDERMATAESAWFQLLNEADDEEEPEYNETDPKTWQPAVRRFEGGAKEYRERPGGPGNVQS